MLHHFVCWYVKCVEKVPFRKSGHILLCVHSLKLSTTLSRDMITLLDKVQILVISKKLVNKLPAFSRLHYFVVARRYSEDY